MAKAQKGKAKQVSTGDSPLAVLATRATTESATQGSAINKVQPIRAYTGQYWFDRFVKTDSKEEQTRMDAVRTAVTAVDPVAFKKSLDEMVAIASKADEAQGFTKETKKLNKGPIYKTAVNTRNVLTRCYGALMYTPEILKELGYTEKTGFHAMAIIANQSLAKKGIKWDGSKAEDAATRAIRMQYKQEEQARNRIMKTNPRAVGEEFKSYNERIVAMLQSELKQMALERTTEAIDKAATGVLKEHDPETARAIAEEIIAALDAQKNGSKKEKQVEQREPELV